MKWILVIAFFVFSRACLADYIVELQIQGNSILFKTQGNKTHVLPNCVEDNNRQIWSASLDGPSGQALYVQLTSAALAPYPVEVVSANDCGVLPGYERVATVRIMP
ncbi:hypothetical protein [Bowmanella denitrificans]|uniref:hypothetical protein n=1 Tax=Bowmanella denitrificans TaxID=366582 RepID=UPI000C9A1CD6|nr:hypothetical protein [Bowmanella denitrificans]